MCVKAELLGPPSRLAVGFEKAVKDESPLSGLSEWRDGAALEGYGKDAQGRFWRKSRSSTWDTISLRCLLVTQLGWGMGVGRAQLELRGRVQDGYMVWSLVGT